MSGTDYDFVGGPFNDMFVTVADVGVLLPAVCVERENGQKHRYMRRSSTNEYHYVGPATARAAREE